METLQGRQQRVVIEYHAVDEWMVMHDSGQIEVFRTAKAALKAIRKAAERGNKTLTLTHVEWRGVPEGGKAPE